MSFWGTKFLFKTYKRKLFNKFSQKHIAHIAARIKIPWSKRISVFCTKARMGNAKILEIVKKITESMHLSFGFSDNFNMQGVSTSLLKSGYLKSEEKAGKIVEITQPGFFVHPKMQ